ncbi:hypothetical protein [Ammoniphilus sp. CFH 90114]|uniref:hypothetical protein n=1 Tax=Ammoniphilus sp. CFH 90114 TaxID=2493665 RepID=UPI00100F10A4|nr:hypothetical protein [Ammoniphilus sp. CFH 90114]RXT14716.1 hypothetical protein EIZ39_00425 [Ammoniphilus sp. CFH 90114]
MEKNRGRITIKLNQPKEGQASREVMDPILPLKEEREPLELHESQESKPQPASETEREEEASKELEPMLSSSREWGATEDSSDNKEKKPFGSDWYLPDDIGSSISTNRRSYKSRTRNSREHQTKNVLGVAASVIGAVVLGLIFGFVVLGFFKSGLLDSPTAPSGAMPKMQEAPVIPTPVPTEEVDDSVAEGGSGEAEASTTVSITLPSNTYYVVQGGVFQDQGSAGPILDNIKAKGWPSSFMGEKPLYLLLGLAAERDDALALAAPYKEMDVYIKEWVEETQTVSVPLKKNATTTQEEWDQWFEREQAMVQALGQAIAEGMTSGKLESESMKQVTDAHRNVLAGGRELISKLPQENQSIGNRMLNDISKGVSAMERYQKQPTEGYLWQAEQALLDAFSSKQAFFSSFK